MAKGKGELETFWLTDPDGEKAVECFEGGADEFFEKISSADDSRHRLVEWAVGLLENKLSKVIAVRTSLGAKSSPVKEKKYLGLSESDFTDTIIHIPPYKKPLRNIEPSEIDIGVKVRDQLRDFVNNIALLYRDNSFHNMEVSPGNWRMTVNI